MFGIKIVISKKIFLSDNQSYPAFTKDIEKYKKFESYEDAKKAISNILEENKKYNITMADLEICDLSDDAIIVAKLKGRFDVCNNI